MLVELRPALARRCHKRLLRAMLILFTMKLMFKCAILMVVQHRFKIARTFPRCSGPAEPTAHIVRGDARGNSFFPFFFLGGFFFFGGGKSMPHAKRCLRRWSGSCSLHESISPILALLAEEELAFSTRYDNVGICKGNHKTV